MKLADILPVIPTLMYYAVLAAVTFALFLPLLLRLFLPRGFSIGHLSLTAVHNFRWIRPDGVTLEVKKLGLARWGGGGHAAKQATMGRKSGRGAWVVLRAEGVWVKVPRKALLAQKKKDATPQAELDEEESVPSPSSADSRRSSTTSFSASAGSTSPSSTQASLLETLARCASGLLTFFAILIEYSVEVEELCKVDGVLSAGGEVRLSDGSHIPISKPQDEGSNRDAKAKAWFHLEHFELRELPRGLDAKFPSSTASAPIALPALSLPQGVILTLSAPFSATSHTRAGQALIRPNSISVDVEFGGKAPEDIAAGAKRAAKGIRRGMKEKVERGRERLTSAAKAATGRGEGDDGEESEAGVHLRVHELKRLLRSFSDLQAQRPSSTTSPRPTSSATTKPNPLEWVKAFRLSLPSFLLSAHYVTPLHIAASSSASADRPLPSSLAFALAIRGVKAEVELGGTTSEEGGGRRDHRAWLGRDREVALRGGFEWREAEGRVGVDGGEDDVLHTAHKTVSIGSSRLDLTSTWLPPGFPSSTSTPLSPEIFDLNPPPTDHNDATVILEAFLGQIRGHAPYETIDAALRIFKARPRPPSSSKSSRDRSSSTSSASFPTSLTSPIEPPPRHPLPPSLSPPCSAPPAGQFLHALPRLIASATLAGIELRVIAPSPTPSAPNSSPNLNGDPTDPFFRSWANPEMLCVSMPGATFTCGGEYGERSVRRSEEGRRREKKERQERKKHARNGSRALGRSVGSFTFAMGGRSRSTGRSVYEDDQDGVEQEEVGEKQEQREQGRETRRFEEEFGVPPPPPLSKRDEADGYARRFYQVKERRVSNLAQDLDKHGLEYSTRFDLTAEPLSVFILATNHGSPSASSSYTSSDTESDAGGALPTLPSDPVRLDVLAAGPFEVSSAVRMLGDEKVDENGGGFIPLLDLSTSTGEHNILLETIGIDLWRPVVRSCLRDFLSSFASASSTATARSRAASETSPPPGSPSTKPSPSAKPKPLVNLLPPNQNLYFALSSFDLRVAGVDPKADPQACRGIAAHSGPFVLEYLLQTSHEPGLGFGLPSAQAGGGANFAARNSLELREDIRVEANASVNPHGYEKVRKTALIKLALDEFSVDPVVDARASVGGRRRGMQPRGDGEGEEARETWELRGRAEMADLIGGKRRKSIVPPRFDPRAARGREKEVGSSLVIIPHLAMRFKVQSPEEVSGGAGKEDALAAPVDEITVNFETEVVTLRLELFSIYLCLVAISSLRSLKPKIQVATADKRRAPSTSPPRPPPLVRLHANLSDLQIFPTLPHDTHLFVNFCRIRLNQSKDLGLAVEFDSALLAGQSATAPGKWEDIARLQTCVFSMREEPGNDGQQPFVVFLSSDTARLRIPFRYIFSRIVDNAANLVKATKQLVYEHIKGGDGFILEPHPEEAKKLPKIELKVGLLAVSMQDDPFETKLNIIWRAGYEEQIARLDREAAFEAKVEAIRRREANGEDEEEEDAEGEDDDRGLFSSFSREGPRVDGRHSIPVDEARRDLLAFNSSYWIKRIRNAAAEQARREEALMRRLYGPKHQNLRPDSRLPIELVPASKSVPLARATFHRLHFSFSRPSFGDDGLADFLHDVGKGLPRNTKFTLLVPLHISWKMEEARFRLRDYPLPLLHVPPGNDPYHAAWECEADLVVAEEAGGKESVRRVPCAIIPQHVFQGQGAPYSIVVPRSAMTVKTYMTPTIKIRTDEPTRIGWGNSIQPAIQDLARVIETLSKASPDPSDRLGFWDKIRLQLHWRVLFQFEGPRASVIFHLKGSRDPYALTGFGAGFAKAWKGNVQFRIGFDNPDHEFFQILSEEYILGIPNLRDYIDAAATGAVLRYAEQLERDDRSVLTGGSVAGSTFEGETDDGTASSINEATEESNYWIKVCAKCINGVRWGLGLVCERTCREEVCSKAGCKERSTFHRQCRFFDFIPHWEVHTKTSAAVANDGEFADSFAGFRSDFVHFSISLTSPATLDLPGHSDASSDASVDYAGEQGYNSFHFTPHANTHFVRWWKTFDGTMSLPIRQGKLFPSAQAPSKKFGKHCATIKYRFSLAPLFISHTYRQESWSEWARGETTVLGLKGKIGRFNVDLHQREQEMSIRRSEMSESKLVKHKAFYMAEIDLDAVDLRTITACFKEPEKAYVAPVDAETEDEHTPAPSAEPFEIADEDVDWINMNDFNDASYTMPDRQPQLRLLPLMSCPRFTYYRHTDAAPVKDTDEDSIRDLLDLTSHEKGKTKFGKEASHTCLMGCATDTITVQIQEAEMRLMELETQLNDCHDKVREHELDLRIRAVHRIIERLQKVRDEAQDSARPDLDESTRQNGRNSSTPSSPSTHFQESEDSADPSHLPHLTNTLYEEWGSWENRYMIHNPTIRVSNATREVLLKYYYSSQDRKGYLYHVSASVIRFIRDLAKEHEKTHRRNWSRRKSMRTGGSASKKNSAWDESDEANRLLDELVNREGGFWAANESQDGERHQFGDHLDVDPESAAAALPEAFDANTGHLCMFIKPQISLQSDIDEKSTLIITAFRAQLKVFSIVDTRLFDDPVNAEVLHQTFARLDGLQVFYPRHQGGLGDGTIHAFVPLETLVDLRVEPWGFDRVVPRTSAAFRYDKFNQLRLSTKRGLDDGGIGPSSTLESHFHTSTDRMSIECEKFSLSANPAHFAAIYNVVTDLILYSDPGRKSRSTKLESLVFTRDFSNLRSVIETVGGLQQKIRGLISLMQEYLVHLDQLDDDGRVELALARAEHLRLASELGFVVEALIRSQDSNGPKTTSKRPGMQLEARAAEVTWFLLDKTDLPFAKFSVIGAEFSWLSKQDGSASNRLVVKDLRALNSSPEQIFAEIIAKHEGGGEDNQLAKVDVFAAALWNSLAPVGGISIIERFELHLHPVRLQLEHRIGRQIIDYLFSERRAEEQQESAPPRSDKPSSPLVVPSNPQSSRSVESLTLPRAAQASSSTMNSSRSANTLASSSASIRSAEHRLRQTVSTSALAPESSEEGLDAEEMRRRAASNRTFIFVEISSTILCLTYRSEKEDKSSLPNIYNITYKTPAIQYRSKTWSFLELLNEIKRDTLKSVWQQKGQLLGQLLSKTHRTLPLADARSAAKARAVSAVRSRLLKHRLGAKRDDPLMAEPLPPLKTADVPRRQDSDSSSDHAVGTDGEDGLPFDVGATELINPEVTFDDHPLHARAVTAEARGSQVFSEEPDKLSILHDGTVRPSMLKRPSDSSRESGSRDRDATSERSGSNPPRQPTSTVSASYPHHEPLRRGAVELKEDEKRRILLGKGA